MRQGAARLLLLAVLFVGCGDGTEDYKPSKKAQRSLYAVVASCPNDGATLLKWVDELNWHDTSSTECIGWLIERGRIRVTPGGLVAVPPEEWPKIGGGDGE